MSELGSQSTPFSIPKLKRTSTEGALRKITLKSHDGSDILGGMSRAFLDPQFSGQWETKSISMVDNREMEKEFRKKKSEMKDEGRSIRELQEHFAFRCLKDEHTLTKIVKEGYKVKPGNSNILGKSACGVYVSRHPDVELRNLKGCDRAILMVFKVILGRCKTVPPTTGDTVEPTPNYDSHVSNRPAQIAEDAMTQYEHSQVYLYEYNDEALPSAKPRHCLPYAVLQMAKASSSSQSAYNQVRSNYNRNPPLGVGRSAVPPARVPAPQHTIPNKEPDQAEEANKAPRVVPTSMTCVAPSPLLRNPLEMAHAALQGRGDGRLMMRRNSGPEAATAPAVLSPALALISAADPALADSNSLCPGCMYPSTHCPTHGEVAKHRAARRASAGGTLVQSQKPDTPAAVPQNLPSPPVTTIAQAVSSPFHVMMKKVVQVFGQANTAISQDMALSLAGSVSHLQVGSVPHMQAGSVPHIQAGSVPHMQAGSVPHMQAGSVPHMPAAELLPAQRLPPSVPSQQARQFPDTSLRARCFPEESASLQPPPFMGNQRSDLEYRAAQVGGYPRDPRGTEDRWSGDLTMMSTGVADLSVHEKLQQHSSQQVSSEGPIRLSGSPDKSQTSVGAGTTVTLPPNFQDLAAQIRNEDIKKILSNCSSETKEKPKPVSSSETKEKPKPVRNSSLYLLRRKKRPSLQSEMQADAPLTSQQLADNEELIEQSTTSESQNALSCAETSGETPQFSENVKLSSEISSLVPENETELDSEQEKLDDTPEEQNNFAVDNTEIVEKSLGKQAEAEAASSDAWEESKKVSPTDIGENQSGSSTESVDLVDHESSQEANSNDTELKSSDELPAKSPVSHDADANCSGTDADRSHSPPVHDESSRHSERGKNHSLRRESDESSTEHHRRRVSSDSDREYKTRRERRRDSPTLHRSRRVSYRRSRSPPASRERSPLRGTRVYRSSSDDYHSSSARDSRASREGRRLREQGRKSHHRSEDEDHEYRPSRDSRYSRATGHRSDRRVFMTSQRGYGSDNRMASKSWSRRDLKEEARSSYDSRERNREDPKQRHSQTIAEARSRSLDCDLTSGFASRGDNASYGGVQAGPANRYGHGFSQGERENDGVRKAAGEKIKDSPYPESYETSGFRSRCRDEEAGERGSAHSSTAWHDTRHASQTDWSEVNREPFRSSDLHFTARCNSLEMEGNRFVVDRAGRDGASTDATYCTGASQDSYSSVAPVATKAETWTRQPDENADLSYVGGEPQVCKAIQDDDTTEGFWRFPASKTGAAFEGNPKSSTQASAEVTTKMVESDAVGTFAIVKPDVESSSPGDGNVKLDDVLGGSKGYWGPPVDLAEGASGVLLPLGSASTSSEQKTETNVMDDRESSVDLESKSDVPKGTPKQGQSESGGKAKKKKVDRDMACYKRRRKRKKNKSAAGSEDTWSHGTLEGGDEESLSQSDGLSSQSSVSTPDVMLVDFVKMPLGDQEELSCQTCEEARKPLANVNIPRVQDVFPQVNNAERMAAGARVAGGVEPSSRKESLSNLASSSNATGPPASPAAGPKPPVFLEPASLYHSDESTLEAFPSASEKQAPGAVSCSKAQAKEPACTDKDASSAVEDGTRIFHGVSPEAQQASTDIAGSKPLVDKENVHDHSSPKVGSAVVEFGCSAASEETNPSVTVSEEEIVQKEAPSDSYISTELQTARTELSHFPPSDPSGSSISVSVAPDASKSSVQGSEKHDNEEVRNGSTQIQMQTGSSEEASTIVDSLMTKSHGEVDLEHVSIKNESIRPSVLTSVPSRSASGSELERGALQREDECSIVHKERENSPPSGLSSNIVANASENSVTEVKHPSEVEKEPRVLELKDCEKQARWKKWRLENPSFTVKDTEGGTGFGSYSSSEPLYSSEQSPPGDGVKPGFQSLASSQGVPSVLTGSVLVKRLSESVEISGKTEGREAAKKHTVNESSSSAVASHDPAEMRGGAGPRVKEGHTEVKGEKKGISTPKQSCPVDDSKQADLDVGTHTTSCPNPPKKLSISICMGKRSKQEQSAKEEALEGSQPVAHSDPSGLSHSENCPPGKSLGTTLSTQGKGSLLTRFPPSMGQAIPVLGAVKSSTPSQGKKPMEIGVSKAATTTTTSPTPFSASDLEGQPFFLRTDSRDPNTLSSESPASIDVLVTGPAVTHSHGTAPKQPDGGSNSATNARPGGLLPTPPSRSRAGLEPIDVLKPISSVISASKSRFSVDPTPVSQSAGSNVELKSASSSERVQSSLLSIPISQSEKCESLVPVAASLKEFQPSLEVRGNPIETLGKGNLSQHPASAGQQMPVVNQSQVFPPPTSAFSYPPPAMPLQATRPILHQHIPPICSLPPPPIRPPPPPEVHPPLSTRVHPPPPSQVCPPMSQVRPPPPNQLHQPPSSQMHQPPPAQMHHPPPPLIHQPLPSRMHQPPPSQMHQPPPSQMHHPPPSMIGPLPSSQVCPPPQVQSLPPQGPPPAQVHPPPPGFGQPLVQVNTRMPPPMHSVHMSGECDMRMPVFPGMVSTVASSVPAPGPVTSGQMISPSFYPNVHRPPPPFPTPSTSVPSNLGVMGQPGTTGSDPFGPSNQVFSAPMSSSGVVVAPQPPLFVSTSVPPPVSIHSQPVSLQSSQNVQGYPSMPSYPPPPNEPMVPDSKPPQKPKKQDLADWFSDKLNPHKTVSVLDELSATSQRNRERSSDIFDTLIKKAKTKHDTDELWALAFDKNAAASPKSPSIRSGVTGIDMDKKLLPLSTNSRRACTPSSDRDSTPERVPVSSKQSNSSSRIRRSSTPERQTSKRTSSPVISNKEADNLSAKPMEYLKKRREMLLSSLEKLPAAENASSPSPNRQESQRERILSPLREERKITVISHHRQAHDEPPIQEGSSRFPANEKSCQLRDVQMEKGSSQFLSGSSAKPRADVSPSRKDSLTQDRPDQPLVEKDPDEGKIETIPLLLNTQVARHGRAQDNPPFKSRKSRFDVVPAASSSRFTITSESSTSNVTAAKVTSPKQRTVGLLTAAIHSPSVSVDSNTHGAPGRDSSAATDVLLSESLCRRVFITVKDKGADDSHHEKQNEDECPIPRKVFVTENSTKSRFVVKPTSAEAELERPMSKTLEGATENSASSHQYHITPTTKTVEKALERLDSQAAHISCKEEKIGERLNQRTGEPGVTLGKHKASFMVSSGDGNSASKKSRRSNEERSDSNQFERIISVQAKVSVKTEPMDTSYGDMSVPQNSNASQTKQNMLLPPVALENISDDEDNLSDVSDEVDDQVDSSNCPSLYEYIKYKLMVPDPRIICEKLACPGDLDLERVGHAEASRLRKKCGELAREFFESLPKEERPRNFRAAVQMKSGTLRHLRGRLEEIGREQLLKELKIVRACIQELNAFFLNPEPKHQTVAPQASGAGSVHIPGVGKMENFKVKTIKVEEGLGSAMPLSHNHEALLTSSMSRFPKKEPGCEEDTDDFDKLEYSPAPELCQNMIIVPGYGKMSIENYLLHKEALEQAEGDLMEAMKVHGKGILPHQKLPHELLTQDEKNKVFSEESNFLFLYCTLQQGAYIKLRNMRSQLEELDTAVAEYRMENRVTDLRNAKVTRHRIHDSRQQVMTTFVGSISGKRIRRLTTLKIRYRLLLDYMCTQLDPEESKQLIFLRSQLGAISNHLWVVQKEMKVNPQLASSSP